MYISLSLYIYIYIYIIAVRKAAPRRAAPHRAAPRHAVPHCTVPCRSRLLPSPPPSSNRIHVTVEHSVSINSTNSAIVLIVLIVLPAMFTVEHSAETVQRAVCWSTWRVKSQATFASLHLCGSNPPPYLSRESTGLISPP